VSPVHGNTAWGDDVLAGRVFGPVYLVSHQHDTFGARQSSSRRARIVGEVQGQANPALSTAARSRRFAAYVPVASGLCHLLSTRAACAAVLAADIGHVVRRGPVRGSPGKPLTRGRPA
jgi:hypothetical protein